MATQEIRNTVIPAPYLPFKTFLSSLDPFAQGIPPKIDRSLWNQSGFVQGLIMNAYRYFHLVDAQNKPTPAFQHLVKSKNDERKAEIKKLLEIGYPEIMMQDLSTMTPKILDELMDKYNVTGETKKKAVTFFLQAAKFAAVPLSNFLTEKIRSTGGQRKRVLKPKTGNGGTAPGFIPSMNGAADPAYDPDRSGRNTKTVRLDSGGTLTLSINTELFSLTGDDRTFVFDLIDKLQQYEADHSSDDENTEEDEQV